MNAKSLIAWRERLGYNQSEACRKLGLSRTTLAAYERGQKIPNYIALACAAIAHGLPPQR